MVELPKPTINPPRPTIDYSNLEHHRLANIFPG